MITGESRLTLDRGVRFRRFEDDGIVIVQDSAEVLVVSDVATRLLEMADGTRPLRECASVLEGEFDADAALIEQDLVRFAGKLVELGIAAVV